MPKTFYIGIKGLIVYNNKILLLKCKNDKQNYYWDLPGGRMEEGETITDTLIRELHEELSNIQNIQVHELITAYKYPSSLSDGQGLILLIYKVTALLPEIILSNEHVGYIWVGKDEINSIGYEAEINAEYKQLFYQSLVDK